MNRESNAKKTEMPVQNETFEKDALKKVIRENWKGRLDDTRRSDVIALNLLDEHAAKMGRMLETFEYEAICVPNIITNSRQMSIGELRSYLMLLEALAMGYRYSFDNEFVSTFLAGLTLKSRDLQSINKHFDKFVEGIEKKSTRYSTLSKREEKRVGVLFDEIKKRESSIFRFFKKGEIKILKEQTEFGARKIRKYSVKASRYSNLLLKAKGAELTGGYKKA